MRDVDAIVSFWKTSRYQPAPARPREELIDFVKTVEQELGFTPAADHLRFLELCDGGQRDAVWLWGIDHDETSNVLDNCANYETGKHLYIGGSGNIDFYVLRPDGRADIIGHSGPDTVFEAFPTFTAMLDRLVHERTEQEEQA